MKIAVPTDDGRTIASHFGRARHFIIFEADDGQIGDRQMVENNPYHGEHHPHGEYPGAKHSHGRFISLLEGCEVIISRGMGRRAVADLEVAGIKPVFTDVADAEEAAKAYSEGTLKPCEAPGCGHP